jgi:hypothetical protein
MISFFAARFLNTWLNGITFSRIFISCWLRQETLFLTCPHFFPLHEEPYDFWRPTHYAIRFFAKKHGLEVEEDEKLGSGWDVLGTLLARQEFRPRARTLPLRVSNRLCNALRWRMFSWLRSGYVQKLVTDQGPFYLANLFVLKKEK